MTMLSSKQAAGASRMVTCLIGLSARVQPPPCELRRLARPPTLSDHPARAPTHPTVVITRMVAADPLADIDELASAHKEVFEEAGVWPANTTFGGTLVREWIKVEIEATAVVLETKPAVGI